MSIEEEAATGGEDEEKDGETVDLLVWLANVFDGGEIERETLKELSTTNDMG